MIPAHLLANIASAFTALSPFGGVRIADAARVGLSGVQPPAHPASDAREPSAAGSNSNATVRLRRFEAILHEDLAPIAPQWTDLQTTGSCTAYQRIEWVRAILEHLVEPTMTPLFVEIRDRRTSETLMIWPLVTTRRLGLTIVEWLDLGVSDYAAPLIAAGLTVSAEEAAAIWSSVKSVLPATDLIDIVRIPHQVAGRPNPLSLLDNVRTSRFHASGVALTGSPETLIKRLVSKSGFRDISKMRNRLSRCGRVELAVAKTDAEVDATFDRLLAHRRARFQRLGRCDLLQRPAVEAFYRSCAKSDPEAGHVQLLGLLVDGVCIAASYCLIHDGAIHGLLLSMSEDEAWKKCAPGIVMAMENIVWARQQGLDYFDFTIGDLSYKSGFGTVPKEIGDLAEATSLRGAGLLAAMRLVGTAKQWLIEHPPLFERLRSARQALRRAYR